VKHGWLIPRGVDSERVDSEPPSDVAGRVRRFLSEGAGEAIEGLDTEVWTEQFEEAPESRAERLAEAGPGLVQGREEPAERVGRPRSGQEAELDEREAALTDAIEERERALAAREGELTAREAALGDVVAERSRLAELAEEIATRQESLEREAAELAAREARLADVEGRERALAERTGELDEREAALGRAAEDRERAFAAREGELAAREAAFGDQVTYVVDKRRWLEEMERLLALRAERFERDLARRLASLSSSPAPPFRRGTVATPSALSAARRPLPSAQRVESKRMLREEAESDDLARSLDRAAAPLEEQSAAPGEPERGRTRPAVAHSQKQSAGPTGAGARCETIASVLRVGGRSVVVQTVAGRQIRITAARDPDTGEFVSEYETMAVESPEGSGVRVWQWTDDYPLCTSTNVEDCLEAAVERVEAGPGPDDLGGDQARATGVGQADATARRRDGSFTRAGERRRIGPDS
jgi:hypothetical protein